MGLSDDLAAYYDAEARAGRRRTLGRASFRVDLRERFADRLRAERRVRLIDVGAGPASDTVDWRDAGFQATAVDLGVENCRVARGLGVEAVSASLLELPLRDGAFEAMWTMSTFVHIPDDLTDAALAELVRVVEPGALLGIGTWGGRDFEGVPEFGDFRPYRFFSLMAHDRWREALARHAAVEHFETFAPMDDSGWEYQFAILRSPR